MLHALLAPLRLSLRRTLRRAAFGAVGGLLLLVGVFFLTLAVWIALSVALGALTASLIMGLGFVGAGLILLALAARRPDRPAAPVAVRPPPPVAQEELIRAFLSGLEAGKAMRRR